jgi:hypothetical protein
MNRNLSPIRKAAAIALVIAAPFASAEQPAPRHIDEPVWSEFVYEKIGATPSIRFGRTATAPAQAADKRAAVASRGSDTPSSSAPTEERSEQPATVAAAPLAGAR